MTITLDEELTELLQAQATREGRDTDTLARELLADSLRYAERDFSEAVEGINRGLADFEAGRCRSLSQVIDDARKRHGFPADWPRSTATDK